ncbi:hypothetical protein DCO49_00370 [Stenotrophomonas sp. SPM]|nr:hypothetical protein DCO49_00370 [Stenotrophomonas sp. SPM]
MRQGRDGEALEALKRLLAVEPDHADARHLLAALYAQLGMMARAEACWSALLDLAPSHEAARFQFGKLLTLKGDADAVQQVLQPLITRTDDIGCYAQAMVAGSTGDDLQMERLLAEGLSRAQSNPALAGDMSQWLEHLRRSRDGGPVAAPAPSLPEVAEPVSVRLSRYGQH